ncbi:MAG: glycosyl hydrolase [Cytophagaceae bacterium]|nr:glycosyl hydrolase [Cytophagaceae bacterium]
MKKLGLIAALAFVLVACQETKKESATTAEVDTAETQKEQTTSSDNQEWEILFDGSNLDNFRGYLADEMYPEWTIDGDAMMFTPSEEGGRNIITKDTYTNFVLSLEWKISEGGNSGIFYGVKEDPKYKEAYQTGPEIQVLDDAKHPDANRGGKTHRAGALYDMIAPKDGVANPAGSWNKVVLTINHDNNKGTVVMNDVEMYSFPTHGTKWEQMIANSKFDGWEGFGAYKTGHIGLQDHSDKVWYRNIKIKRLD